MYKFSEIFISLKYLSDDIWYQQKHIGILLVYNTSKNHNLKYNGQ
jgi:hypothetical protein